MPVFYFKSPALAVAFTTWARALGEEEKEIGQRRLRVLADKTPSAARRDGRAWAALMAMNEIPPPAQQYSYEES